MKVRRPPLPVHAAVLRDADSTLLVQVLELDREEHGSAVQAYLAERAGASRVTVPQVRLVVSAHTQRLVHPADTTPRQVYIKGQSIGGCSDLKKLQASGKLDELLA